MAAVRRGGRRLSERRRVNSAPCESPVEVEIEAEAILDA
jgi:hypothetical protein